MIKNVFTFQSGKLYLENYLTKKLFFHYSSFRFFVVEINILFIIIEIINFFIKNFIIKNFYNHYQIKSNPADAKFYYFY